MIKNIQISGDIDLHPEQRIYDAKELASGSIDLASLTVKEHHIKIFDLLENDQRDAYSELYILLSDKAKRGKIYIMANSRETLTKADGSVGLYKYVEWVEFDTSEILGA